MKKHIITIFLALIFSTSFSQMFFKTVDLVDEFGDKIGSVNKNVSSGLFSNSATTNSPLIVNTILKINPAFTLDEYKKNLEKDCKNYGYSQAETEKTMKYAESGYELSKNTNGVISFELLEYENLTASFIGLSNLSISIKTADGRKISTSLPAMYAKDGVVFITGYKEITSGSTGVKNAIKYGYYDWRQTEIYNEIVNASASTQIVINADNSTYKFVIE
jgi:hypothetical protein